MKYFNRSNPVPVFLYFAVCAVLCAIIANPYFTAVSFVSAFIIFIMLRGSARVCAGFFAIGAAIVLFNPLISRKGDTVLVFIGDLPVTLESFIYGLNSAFTVVTVLLLSYGFSKLITSRKMLYLMAPLSPTAALTVSMVLRFAPRCGEYAKRTADQQKAIGAEEGGSIPEKTRFYLRIFSALTTWALESGVVISDSMAARGYGVGRRRYYSGFGFRYGDVVFTAAEIILAAAVAVLSFTSDCGWEYYPTVSVPDITAPYAACFAAYTVLSFLPLAAELADGLKWKYLLQKI